MAGKKLLGWMNSPEARFGIAADKPMVYSSGTAEIERARNEGGLEKSTFAKHSGGEAVQKRTG